MKKISILLLALIISSFVNAQFKATPNGIATEDGNNFIVIEVKDKTAEELFNSTESYILQTFKNPSLVKNNNNGSIINMHGVFTDAFPYDKYAFKKGYIYADVDLNLVMHFKDGKIKFETPHINKMYVNNASGTTELYFSASYPATAYSIFTKNGKIKNEVFLDGFNTFINSLVEKIANCSKQQDVSNDW